MEQNLSFAVPFSSQNPILCGMTIHIHRNLSGYLFPSKIQASDKTKIGSFILSTLKPMLNGALCLESPLPLDAKETFPAIGSDLHSLIVDSNQKTTYAVVDQDHLVVTLHTHETEFKKIYDQAKAACQKIDTLFNYAFHQKSGFLTSFPEMSGLGIRLEAFLFCPLMETAPEIDSRFQLEPFFGHKSLYVLKSRQTHNLELSELIQKFLAATEKVIKTEQDARDGFLKANKDQLIDQVSKSLALLKGAFQMNFSDTLHHLLNLKLGYHLKLIKGLAQDNTLNMIWQASRSHLSETLKQKETKDDWLHERADWLKQSLAQVEIHI